MPGMLKEIFIFILAMALFAACTNDGDGETAAKKEQRTEDTNTGTDTADATDEGKESAKPLTVKVNNVSGSAPVVIRVYTQDNFLDKEGDKNKYSIEPQSGIATQQVEGLPYGQLALVAYVDENSNGDLDRNGVGVPQEPYIFSNNFKPSVKAPDFSDCSFTYSEESNTVTVNMPGKK
jgi:uncharacterized protein (DUF2141 family)